MEVGAKGCAGAGEARLHSVRRYTCKEIRLSTGTTISMMNNRYFAIFFRACLACAHQHRCELTYVSRRIRTKLRTGQSPP